MVTKIQKGDYIQYIDKSNNVLENGRLYKVNKVLEFGSVQVIIPTGYVGLTHDRFLRVSDI